MAIKPAFGYHLDVWHGYWRPWKTSILSSPGEAFTAAAFFAFKLSPPHFTQRLMKVYIVYILLWVFWNLDTTKILPLIVVPIHLLSLADFLHFTMHFLSQESSLLNTNNGFNPYRKHRQLGQPNCYFSIQNEHLYYYINYYQHTFWHWRAKKDPGDVDSTLFWFSMTLHIAIGL